MELIIFLKAPDAGKVKTRLAASVGNDEALRIYKLLVDHTFKLAKGAGFKTTLWFANAVDGQPFPNMDGFEVKTQSGSDLGERMHNSFQDSAPGKKIIIGSDCAELSIEILLEAAESLNQNDLVFGPAKDGGYYLVGQKNHNPELFLGKEWSHEHVLQEALDKAHELELKVHLLPKLSDVDNIDDWNMSKHLLNE